jgi:hypothetical protein
MSHKMVSSTIIDFLENNQIDKQRWDVCISNSPNSLLYARASYLDNIAPNWKGLIGENYDWVLPVTARSKWGFTYLYQPPLTQQLGVFAKAASVEIPWANILGILKKKYRFWEINVNYLTPVDVFPGDIRLSHATNFVLPLQTDYQNIRLNYHKDLIRNLKRSQQFRLVYKPEENFKLSIETYTKAYGNRMQHVTDQDYKRFTKICGQAAINNQVVCRKAVNQQNELMATVLLLTDGKRLYNMMNTTTAAGRKVEANHFLMDAVIREFAGQDLVLDFEGSDLPGVKSFYENFGGENQPYFMLKYNNLPWPLKLLKR